MTTTAVSAPVPKGGLANALWKRQLSTYPNTWPRIGYLAIVVLTTIMLYYLYYVEGAVTPLLLPYYHMSFQFFLYLLVVSNAIGAFSAFIGGLSDKIGRANLTIYGTLVVALVQLLAIPHIHDKWGFAAAYCVIGFVEGVILVSTPALMRDFSPQMGRGVAMGFWALGPTMGALAASLVATHTLSHLTPWQDQFIISGLVCLGVVIIAFFFLRELSPQLRDQLMVSERERALVDARAMGIDVEQATAHPIRSMMRLDLISSSIAISVFLLFYYASVSVLTIYWVVIYNRSTPQANGINVWYAAFLSGGLVVAGFLSDWARVRKPFMLFGAVCAMVMMGFLIVQTGHPHTGLLRQRPGDRPPGGLHFAGLRPVDGQLHRAGRVPQSRPDRVGARGVGLDPPHHGGAVVPGAALRDHDLHDPGGQPDRGHGVAGDPGRASPMRHRPRRQRAAPTSAPASVIAGLRATGETGPKTLATIIVACNATHNLTKALTAAGGLSNPQVLGLIAYNPLATAIQKGKPVSQAQIHSVAVNLAEPGQPPGRRAEARAGAEDLAGRVEALVGGVSRRPARLRGPRLLHAGPLEPTGGPARPGRARSHRHRGAGRVGPRAGWRVLILRTASFRRALGRSAVGRQESFVEILQLSRHRLGGEAGEDLVAAGGGQSPGQHRVAQQA